MSKPDMIDPLKKWQVFAAGISALILTVGIARFAYTPLLPVMRVEAGLSVLAGGWLATVNYMGYLAGAVLAASISRLEQKFVVYRIGLVLAVLTTAAMGFTDDVYAWAVLRLLSGFSSTAGMLLASGLILNWLIYNQHRPKLGLHFLGLGTGLALSGICAVAMAGRLAWDQEWLAFSLIGAGFFVPAWFWMPAPTGRAPTSSHTTTTAPAAGWMRLLHAAYFCAGFGYVISATFIVAIVGRLSDLSRYADWTWVAVGVAAVPSSFFWDRLASRIGEIPALMTAYAIQILSILLCAASDGAAANIAGAALFGGTFAGIVGQTLALTGRFFPHNPAKAMARLTLSYGAAQIVAPAIAGVLASESGGYRSTLFIAALVMVAGLGFLAAMAVQQRPVRDALA